MQSCVCMREVELIRKHPTCKVLSEDLDRTLLSQLCSEWARGRVKQALAGSPMYVCSFTSEQYNHITM